MRIGGILCVFVSPPIFSNIAKLDKTNFSLFGIVLFFQIASKRTIGKRIWNVVSDLSKSTPFPGIRNLKRYLIRYVYWLLVSDFLIRSIIGIKPSVWCLKKKKKNSTIVIDIKIYINLSNKGGTDFL